MAEQILAYDAQTGEKTLVNRRWVDNPAIGDGRYVSQLPTPKTSRPKRGPVDTNTEPAPDSGDSTEETS